MYSYGNDACVRPPASCDAQVILAALVTLLAAHCLLLGAAFTNWAGSSAADAGRSEN